MPFTSFVWSDRRRIDKALREQRAHELALARIAAGGKDRTPGKAFMRGLNARIKAGGPQGSQADRDRLKSNPPPTASKKKKKKDDDEGRG